MYTEGAYSYIEVQDGKNISSLAHNRNYIITSCTVNYSFIVKNCFCLQEIYKNVFSFLYLKVGFTIHVLKKLYTSKLHLTKLATMNRKFLTWKKVDMQS